MQLPAIYDKASPPNELGYTDLEFRVRVNPTHAIWLAFLNGGTADTPDNAGKRAGAAFLLTLPFRAPANATPEQVEEARTTWQAEQDEARADIAACDAAVADARMKLGRALTDLYGTTELDGFDFSTPEAALATLEHDDMPEDLATWLLTLPHDIKRRRADLIVKKLASSWRETTPFEDT